MLYFRSQIENVTEYSVDRIVFGTAQLSMGTIDEAGLESECIVNALVVKAPFAGAVRPPMRHSMIPIHLPPCSHIIASGGTMFLMPGSATGA